MGKLHEVLAVENDIEKRFNKILQETIATFSKKPDHFLGFHRHLEMKDDNRRVEEEAAIDNKKMETTVDEKLDYFCDFAGDLLNIVYQKESSNQEAIANVVIEDVTIMENVPVGFLVAMERRLNAIRAAFDAIPTLQPGVEWEEDANTGVFKTKNDEVRIKSEKTAKSKILVEPTEHHPAQIEKWYEDIPVGIFKKTSWSGMLPPKRKHEMLQRIDKLSIAIKKARQRANSLEVPKTKTSIAKNIFDYIRRTDNT